MTEPKRKTSKARRDKRRASVWKLEMPGITKCPKCGEYNKGHRVCSSCGSYAGREVVKKEEKKAKTS